VLKLHRKLSLKILLLFLGNIFSFSEAYKYFLPYLIHMAKCPFCKKEVTLKNVDKEVSGFGLFKQETIYSCPNCKSVLGFSRGKWFN